MLTTYLKGLRTKYWNQLEEEMAKSLHFLTKEIEDHDIAKQIINVNIIIRRLKEFGGKLDETTVKLYKAIEVKGDKEEIEKLSTDCERVFEFMDAIMERSDELFEAEETLQERKSTMKKEKLITDRKIKHLIKPRQQRQEHEQQLEETIAKEKNRESDSEEVAEESICALDEKASDENKTMVAFKNVGEMESVILGTVLKQAVVDVTVRTDESEVKENLEVSKMFPSEDHSKLSLDPCATVECIVSENEDVLNFIVEDEPTSPPSDDETDDRLPQRTEVKQELNLLGSELGWILTGRSQSNIEENSTQNLVHLDFADTVHTQTNLRMSVDQMKRNFDEIASRENSASVIKDNQSWNRPLGISEQKDKIPSKFDSLSHEYKNFKLMNDAKLVVGENPIGKKKNKQEKWHPPRKKGYTDLRSDTIYSSHLPTTGFENTQHTNICYFQEQHNRWNIDQIQEKRNTNVHSQYGFTIDEKG